jgi:hypothetical protein
VIRAGCVSYEKSTIPARILRGGNNGGKIKAKTVQKGSRSEWLLLMGNASRGDFMKLSAVNIVRTVVIAFLIGIAVFFIVKQYNRHLQILEYQEQNIYEITTKASTENVGKALITSYFMICDPKNSEEELKTQMEEFLSKEAILKKLQNQYAPDRPIETICYHLIFVRPTKSWPIGKFPTDTQPFDLWTDMPLSSVIIENGESAYRYHPYNFTESQ